MRKGVRQVFLVGILVSHSLLGLQKKIAKLVPG